MLRLRLWIGSSLAIASVLVGVQPAGALTPTELCRRTIATQSRVYFTKVLTALRSCENKIDSGALPPATDCTTEPITMGHLSDALTLLGAKIDDKCDNSHVMGLTFGGDCQGVASVPALVTCLSQTHMASAQAITDTLYPTVPQLNPDQASCQKKLAVSAARIAKKRLGLIQKCEDKVYRGILPPATVCAKDLSVTKSLNKLVAKTQDKVITKCPDVVTTTMQFAAPCEGKLGAELLTCALCYQPRQEVANLLLAEFGSGVSGTASVAQITNPASCIGGPLSRCRVNDYLMSNNKIRVVIQDVQRNIFGIGQYGGQIIDGDRVRVGLDPDRDNFEEWSFSINIESTAHYTALTVINDGSDGKAAVLRATGVDDLLDFLNPSSIIAGFGFQFPGQDDADLPVNVVTDYILEPGADAVRVETTVVNTGGTTLDIFLGDFLNGSGQVELFQSGYAFGEPLTITNCPTTALNKCDFVAWAGEKNAAGVSYGYLSDTPNTGTFTTSGVTVSQFNTYIVFALTGANQPPFHIAPTGQINDSVTLTRHFVVAQGEVSHITDVRNEMFCRPVGTIQGQATVAGSPVAGADISVLGNTNDGPGGLAINVVTHTRTDSNGYYAVTLAPGDYNVLANLDGHPFEGGAGTPPLHPVTVKLGKTTVQNVDFPLGGAIRVLVEDEGGDPIAAKASIVGFDPSPAVLIPQSIFGLIHNTTSVFGEAFEDGEPFGVAQTLFIDASGDSGVVPIEPGSYQAVVSHGPEFSTYTIPVTITAGATTTVNAVVERVVDSSGFISGDFHVHSIDSPDAAVTRTDRVISMLAEGVDFFASTDHDIRTDFTQTINDLGVSSLINTTTGAEMTTFDYGHFNGWPLTIDPAQVNGGSVDHGGAAPVGMDFPVFGNYSMDPNSIIKAALADPGTDTVQVNHIHSHFGLDGGSGLAIDTAVVPPQSTVPAAARRLDPNITNYFSDAFTALEVWIGDDRSQIATNFLGQNAGDWFNMMNQGIIRTGVSDSDTHGTKRNVSGYPRTMIASPTDDPGSLAAIADTLSGNVNAGRAFGTNGPMVRVTATADSTAQTAGLELGLPLQIDTNDGAVEIEVEVQSPTWAEFDKIEFYINPTTTRTTLQDMETGAGEIDVNRYSITPTYTRTAPGDFTVSTVPEGGSARLEATYSLSLTGLTDDIWVVVMVKGTDGVSRPLFPVVPNSLKQNTNTTLANLIDGNVGEDGVMALAFTNPLFINVDGGAWTPPGVQVNP